MTQRYYLHGDEHETQCGKFYCSRHDDFVTRGHFYTDCDVENDWERFMRELKYRKGIDRPAGASNLFA